MKLYLWSLKLGGLLNLFFLGQSFLTAYATTNPHILIPARIFFAVSAYRCMFPVRYKNNIVFHDSVFSSIFLTRVFATFSEVALIYQLSYLIRLLNVNQIFWVNFLSWLMVALVLVSQFFVWGAILLRTLTFYFFEELGWSIIYAINTLTNLYLCANISFPQTMKNLVHFNIFFGLFYLPWQYYRLRNLSSSSRNGETNGPINFNVLSKRLIDSIQLRNPSSEYKDWGGFTGMIWMTGYWATLIPIWVLLILHNINTN